MTLTKRLEEGKYHWAILNKHDTLSELLGISNFRIEQEINFSRLSLFLYYKIGGYRGGNCWDDTTPEYVNICHEGIQLSNIFLELTGFQLQELKVETVEFTEYEYYGNTTDYKAIIIAIEDIQNLYQKYNLPTII